MRNLRLCSFFFGFVFLLMIIAPIPSYAIMLQITDGTYTNSDGIVTQGITGWVDFDVSRRADGSVRLFDTCYIHFGIDGIMEVTEDLFYYEYGP
jgi:hypothetical protein